MTEDNKKMFTELDTESLYSGGFWTGVGVGAVFGTGVAIIALT